MMRVLLAEDEAVSRRVLEVSLKRWNYEVIQVSSGTEAWSVLQGQDPPLIAILDWMMPGITGPELCKRLRALNREPYIYILLLTARSDRQDIVDGLEAGADDYITKPFNSMELEARLRAGKRIVDLHSELMRTRERLRIQATRDALTGLWNRLEILSILEQEQNRTMREAVPLSVALLDIDHFKQVNDTYGHQVGDETLREVSARLQTATRRYDAIGRYGGEEFLAVLPGCTEPDALAIADRLRTAVSEEPMRVQGIELRITLSVGVSTRIAPQNGSTSDLIGAADTGLYLAKASGRDRSHFCPLDPVSGHDPGHRQDAVGTPDPANNHNPALSHDVERGLQQVFTKSRD